jgi:hypothetical protein
VVWRSLSTSSVSITRLAVIRRLIHDAGWLNKHKMKEMATNQEEKECKLKKRQKRFIRS